MSRITPPDLPPFAGPPRSEDATRHDLDAPRLDRHSLGKQFYTHAAKVNRTDRLNLLRQDQTRNWERGNPIRVEEYLRELPVLRDEEESILDLIYSEVITREQLGQAATLEEYVQRFPQYESSLRRQFALHRILEEESMLTPDSPTFLDPRDPKTMAPPTPATIPAILGAAGVAGYEILEEMGRGGMGVVYKARQVGLNRIVALKMILAGVHAGRNELTRFRSEAEAIARLCHPNLVNIYEVGEQDGRPFFSLEFVDGGSLADKLEGTPQAPDAAAKLLEVLARAMHAAHQQGVVHRDLKPGNVLLTGRGVPKISDFGLAKRIDEGGSHTVSGTIVGTPSYMAPEQAAGKSNEVGPAADVYALGAILYELLTGRPPFRAATVLDTLDLVRQQEPVPPTRLQPKVPRDLETICLKCLQKEPRKRYANAEAMADDLHRYLNNEPILARPTGWLERSVKWTKRRPTLAALMAVSALASVLLMAALLVAIYLVQKEQELTQKALERESRALDEKTKALQQVQRTSYLDLIKLTERQWYANNLAQAEQHLDRCTPDYRHWEWFYLKRLCHAYLGNLRGHLDGVNGVAYSPDGRYLASGGADRKIKVWDTTSGKIVARLGGHAAAVSRVAFSPDSKRLASAGQDETVIVWDVAKKLRVLTLLGHDEAVTDVAYSADGKWIATSSDDKTVRIWDALTGNVARVLKGHTERVTSLSFRPDGKWIASAANDKTVIIWDAATGLAIATLKGHTEPVTCVAFSPDGKYLASGSGDTLKGEIKLWNAELGEELRTLRGHAGEVTDLVYSFDGHWLASASHDQTVKVWEVTSDNEPHTFRGHTDWVNSLAFHPDGRRLASAGKDQTVIIWDATTDQESLRLWCRQGDDDLRMDFSPDYQWFASVREDGPISQVKMREVTTGRELPPLRSPEGEIIRLRFSPDGQLLATVDQNKIVRIWNAKTGQEMVKLPVQAGQVWIMVFSPDGKQLALATYDGAVTLWNVATGKRIHTLREANGGTFSNVVFCPDGQRLICDNKDEKAITIWDLETGKEIKSYRLPGPILGFSPDRRRLAFAADDQTAKIRDVITGEELLTLKGHHGEFTLVHFSFDGQRLASSASDDQTIQIWDAATGKELFTLSGHTRPVWNVAFSPDDQRLASASDDGTVKIWDLTVGQEALSLRALVDPSMTVYFSPDGERLVLVSLREVKVWNAAPVPAGLRPLVPRPSLKMKISRGQW